MTVSEKGLVDLAYNGLHSYLKENLLQMRAIGLEFKFKNAKDTFETHQSMHVDCKFDSDDEKKGSC